MTKDEALLILHCARVEAACEHAAMILANDIGYWESQRTGQDYKPAHTPEEFRAIPERFGITRKQVEVFLRGAV